MEEPFIGAEALAAGQLTRHRLRTRFRAIHKGIYVGVGTRPTAVLRAKAAWLRSRRRGVLAVRLAFVVGAAATSLRSRCCCCCCCCC